MSDYNRRNNMASNAETTIRDKTSGGISREPIVPYPASLSGRRPVSITKNNITFTYSEFSPQATIMHALGELAGNGYSLTSGNDVSMIKNSQDLLNSLGYQVLEQENMYEDMPNSVKFSKDFSLAKTLNIDSTIQNNRIVDPDLSDLTPEPILSTDKFKSETDSFYNFDDEKTDNIKSLEMRNEMIRNKKLFKISELLTHESRRSKNKMLKSAPIRNKAPGV